MTNSVRSKDTRRALIDSARDELAETPPGALSLRAVARRAGLSHAAPAHFFGDRAGLLTAVAVTGFELLAAELDDAAQGADVPIVALGRAYLAFARAHPSLLDLMFRGADLDQDDATLQQAKRDAIGRLMGAVREARDDAVPAESLEWTLISWALVHGMSVLGRERMLAPFGDDQDTTDESIADRLLQRYTAAIAPSPEA